MTQPPTFYSGPAATITIPSQGEACHWCGEVHELEVTVAADPQETTNRQCYPDQWLDWPHCPSTGGN